MYISRWLTAPIENKLGDKRYRDGRGTPQGGVISPLLANLFLHYTFDKWFSNNYPELRFVRYADDIIVHCNNQLESEKVLSAIKRRMEECRLELNKQKTKIVYCKNANRKLKYKTVQFDFLGFSFQPRPTPTKDGKMFLGYDCSISRKSIKKISNELRKSRFHLWATTTITQIAEEFNPKIRGWINYYGKFRKFGLMRVFKIFHWRLIKWAVSRYKRFNNSMHKAGRWIRQIAKCFPNIFIHWQYGYQGA
jgi:group II intron reverse transcriptase/maturase